MPLNPSQQAFIAALDNEAKRIIKQGGQEALLMSLSKIMPTLKDIMDSATKDELNQYCEQYDGFYQYMKLLENMARGISQGTFDGTLK